MAIDDSSLNSSFLGVGSQFGAGVSLSDTDIDAPFAMFAIGGQITMDGGELSDGALYAASKGLISLGGVTQIVNSSGFHLLETDSLLRLSGTAALIGNTSVTGFSNLLMEDTSTLDGQTHWSTTRSSTD